MDLAGPLMGQLFRQVKCIIAPVRITQVFAVRISKAVYPSFFSSVPYSVYLVYSVLIIGTVSLLLLYFLTLITSCILSFGVRCSRILKPRQRKNCMIAEISGLCYELYVKKLNDLFLRHASLNVIVYLFSLLSKLKQASDFMS